jgi:hypothetical protein
MADPKSILVNCRALTTTVEASNGTVYEVIKGSLGRVGSTLPALPPQGHMLVTLIEEEALQE